MIDKILNSNFYKFIFFLLTIVMNTFLIHSSKIKNNIKVCLCTVGKQENNYILDFIKFYKKYGVDKIFLYDNNDINSERFEEIISEYIENNYVKIFNYRGKSKKQLFIYDHCYKLNKKNYDWLIFYDIDEFIFLKNIKNIKEFLVKKKFTKCKSIYLNWIVHTDNNLLYYENESVFNRFPAIYKNKDYCVGKSIVRGNISNFHSYSTHSLDIKIPKCNGFGNMIKLERIRYCSKPDFKYYYINHYQYKSTEEFINKIQKGDCLSGDGNKYKLQKIRRYFYVNQINIEKINLIQNKTGLNISYYYKKIKKKFHSSIL